MKPEKKDLKTKKPARQVKQTAKKAVTNKDFDNKYRDETEDENDLDTGKGRLDLGDDDFVKDDERRESEDEEVDNQLEDDEDLDGEDDDLGSSGKKGGKHRDTSM